MRKFGIIANYSKNNADALAHTIQDYIRSKGGECLIMDTIQENGSDAECIFVLGGDGTLIRAASQACICKVPLVGVNLGHVGYLCELEEKNILYAIDQIMQEHYIMEERMMLRGQVETINHTKEMKKKALNDIVICRTGALQILEFEVLVNGRYLFTFCGDGIIVATPTGSTGYNMSAGGPIVDPKASMIVITPINAQNNSKSIVIGDDNEICIELKCRQQPKEETAAVCFDGTEVATLHTGDKITIRKSKYHTQILKLSNISFLEILRKKMQTNSS